jgi:hypothetical protein
MKIVWSIFFVLANSTSKEELTDLGQASAFLLRDLQKSSLDFTGHPESDAFIFRCHGFCRILDLSEVRRK